MKLFSLLLAGLALAAISLTPGAAAADDPVDVTPCRGVLMTDKAGDQAADQVPALSVPEAAQPTEDNTDIRSVFFNTRTGADGKPVVTANIVITNLTREIPEMSAMDGVSYIVHFATTEDVTYVKAQNEGGDITYHYRYFDATTRLATTGDTTGAFVEGPMGVVQIRLPEQLSKMGTKLPGVYARVSLTSAAEERVAYTTADLAPDDGSSSTKSYTVEECPVADPAPEPAPVAPPVEAPPAPPAPAPAPATAAAPAPAPAPASKPAAKKKKKKKKATCASKVRKLKGKKRAKAMKVCKKKARAKKRR